MPSCYNTTLAQYGQGPTSPRQQSTMHNNHPAASSQYGIGQFGPGQMNFGQGPGNGAALGFNPHFPRPPPPHPPPMMTNPFNPPASDPRFPPPFYGNFPSFGSMPTASTSAASSLAATPSPPPIVQNAHAHFFDPQQMASMATGGNSFQGIGTIVWLTSDRGLIQKTDDVAGGPASDCGPKSPRSNHSDDNNNRNNELASKAPSPQGTMGNMQISFGIKEFCDQNVTDLTTVLRVGYLVKFQAVMDFSALAKNGKLQPPRMIATFICPLSLADWSTASPSVMEVTKKLIAQLDASAGTETLSRDQASKQRRLPYNVDSELRATHLLMNIFREQDLTAPQCPLSTLQCIVSNCRDEEMYWYIGCNSQKRRHYLEQRSHFFFITPDDNIHLGPSSVYIAVSALSRELLQRGGVMQLQELFNQYLTWPDLPLEAREVVGETKSGFMQFLQSHPFIFAMFPSRVFVSLRRRLPDFDYGSLLEECFGDQEGSSSYMACNSARASNAAPTGVTGPNGVGYGHVQQQPPPMASNRWGAGDDRSGRFGMNGQSGRQSVQSGRHPVSPPMFQQPTPPTYSADSRFAQPQNCNFGAFTMPPPPVGQRSATPANYGANQWAPSHGALPMGGNNSAATPSFMTNNISGSNHSLSSGYSTGPAPSTPGLNQSQGQQQFWPANAGRAQAPTPDNVAGFWKSYDLGTESLIRQLNSAAAPPQQHHRTTPTSPVASYGADPISETRRGSRATPDNPFMRPISSASSSAASFKEVAACDAPTQTDRFLMALKCGHCGMDNEWLFPLLTRMESPSGLLMKIKPDTVEAGIQTDRMAGNSKSDETTDALANMRI